MRKQIASVFSYALIAITLASCAVRADNGTLPVASNSTYATLPPSFSASLTPTPSESPDPTGTIVPTEDPTASPTPTSTPKPTQEPRASCTSNCFAFPAIGIGRTQVQDWPECGGTLPSDAIIYSWTCDEVGRNNFYLMGHASGVFAPLRSAYRSGSLRVGQTAVFTDKSGNSHTFTVAWMIRQDTTDWAKDAWWADSSSFSEITLDTCDDETTSGDSAYRITVRLVPPGVTVTPPPPDSTPTPKSTPSPTASPTQTGTPVPTGTPTQTPTASPTTSPTPTPVPTIAPTPTATPTEKPTAEPTISATPTPAATSTPT